MTTDLQRRCAELAGWTGVHMLNVAHGISSVDVLVGWPPNGVDHMPIPDYPHDLNAARGLMALIPEDDDFGNSKQTEFADRLWRITGGALFDLLMATPEQICRAFVEVVGDG